MNLIRDLFVIFILFWSGCGMLSSDHIFNGSIPISEINGSFNTDSIVVCKILKENNISTDSFTAVTTISETGRIISIDLSNREISTITDSINYIYPLNSLNLDSNNLSVLPDNISKLKYLTSLNLANNNLTVLPENFGELINIDYLNLNNNLLSSLPESITQIYYIGYKYEHSSHGGTYYEYVPQLYVDSNYISNVSEELEEWLNTHDSEWKSKQKR